MRRFSFMKWKIVSILIVGKSLFSKDGQFDVELPILVCILIEPRERFQFFFVGKEGLNEDSNKQYSMGSHVAARHN